VLDEAAFQKLLAAAHVLQQHSDRLQTREVFLNPTEILSEIVETQKRIHTDRLGLAVAARLITERLLRITGASGATVALLDGERLAYIAASGNASLELGRRILLSDALSAECVSRATVLHSPDVGEDVRIPAPLRRAGTVPSLVAVPIYHQSRVIGAIELRFAKKDVARESDVNTCELMAGLISQTLARTAGGEPAGEGASNLGAEDMAAPDSVFENLSSEGCPSCGEHFRIGERFCGSCGIELPSSAMPSNTLQQKWASLWYMQKTAAGEGLTRDPRLQPTEASALYPRDSEETSSTPASAAGSVYSESVVQHYPAPDDPYWEEASPASLVDKAEPLPGFDHFAPPAPSEPWPPASVAAQEIEAEPLPSFDHFAPPAPSEPKPPASVAAQEIEAEPLPALDHFAPPAPSEPRPPASVAAQEIEARPLPALDHFAPPAPSEPSSPASLPTKKAKNKPLPAHDHFAHPAETEPRTPASLPTKKAKNKPLPAHDHFAPPVRIEPRPQASLPTKKAKNKSLSEYDHFAPPAEAEPLSPASLTSKETAAKPLPEYDHFAPPAETEPLSPASLTSKETAAKPLPEYDHFAPPAETEPLYPASLNAEETEAKPLAAYDHFAPPAEKGIPLPDYDHFAPPAESGFLPPAELTSNEADARPQLAHDHFALPIRTSDTDLASVHEVIDEDFSTLPGQTAGGAPSPGPASTSPWTSAAKARHWLESLRPSDAQSARLKQTWNAHRGNMYLGASVILLLITLFGWGMAPSPQTTTAKDSGAPELTVFEKFLVGVGLAEPPESAPVYRGNPDTKVWVDLHTALYYCPGAEMYGKTAGGRIETQRNAQQDQFEPANRRACR
jgi:hypothetical protein